MMADEKNKNVSVDEVNLTTEDMMNIRDGYVPEDDIDYNENEPIFVSDEVLEVEAAKQEEPLPEDAPDRFGDDRLIVVTGGAGFIGTHLIKQLNNHGIENIIIVDDLSDPLKINNIKHLKFQDYIDKSKFLELFTFMVEKKMVKELYHLGAESSTTCIDGKYLMENNYQYTCNLMDICAMNNVPMVYASSAAVYGDIDKEWTEFNDKSDDYTPNNYYALSKLQADKYSRKFITMADKARIIGLRYFNVTSDGEHEQHKVGMKSAPCWMKEQYAASGKVTLFIGSDQFMRDFIHVEEAVYCTMNAMHQARSGVYNIGTGIARSFLQIAESIVDDNDDIRYIPMPEELALHYQTYTCANMDNACFGIGTRP